MTPVEPPHSLVRSTEGVRVAVHDLGGPDDAAAPVILFSHATGLHGRVWAPMAAGLVDRYRCYAVDYRGHGVSETPADTSMVWSGMGDDAVAVLDSHLIGPGRIVYGVGHSMGGAALVLAAARRPGGLRSLWLFEPIIVAPVGQPVADGPNPMAEAAIRRRDTFASYDEARANFAAKPPLNELHPDALAAYVLGGFAPQPDGTVSLRCRPASEAAVFEGAFSSGAWEACAGLDLPVTVVAGRDQDFGPVSFARPLVDHLPRGQLLERRHLGHFGPLEDPAAMASEVRQWIRATAP